MAQPLVSDELWSVVAPLLPEHPPQPRGGRPWVGDRVCLAGIIFVLRTGIPWESFPSEMGCCGMTLLNRLRQWHKAGVWEALHRTLLARLRGADKLDFSRVVVDSSSVRAVHGGEKRGPARRTGASGAPSTTWSPTRGASRSRRSSPGPTATT